MNKSIESQWQSLAQSFRWTELRQAIEAYPSAEEELVSVVLWRVQVLRALGQGAKANSELLALARNPFKGTPNDLARLGEELLQSAFYEEAAKMASLLLQNDRIEGDYLFCLLWREREDWQKFDNHVCKLMDAGGQWQIVAIAQQVWALLRQGCPDEAETRLAQLKAEEGRHPSIQKINARKLLAQARYAEAVTCLQALQARQPFDWETPPLLALSLSGATPGQAQEKILDLFAQGLARQPRQPDALTNRARFRLAIGDRVGATEDLEAALAIKPWWDAPLMLRLSDCLERKAFDEALTLIRSGQQMFPSAQKTAALLDVMRMQQLDDKALVKAVDTALDTYPFNMLVLRSAGAALQSVRQYDQAALCYEKALGQAPHDVGLRNNLAQLKRDRGDLEEALSLWQPIAGSSDNRIRLNYAMALVQHGDVGEAKAIFLAILQGTPAHPVALRGMADIALSAGDLHDAWQYAEQSVRNDPTNPLAWKTAARVTLQAKGVEAAARLIRMGLTHCVRPLPLHVDLFRLMKEQGAHDALRQLLEQWAEMEPTEPEYPSMLSQLAYDANQFDACENWLLAAYELDAEQGIKPLVRFYQARDRLGVARRTAAQFLRSAPQTIMAYGLLAEILYLQERHEEALEILDKGLRVEPHRLSLLRQMAGMLLSQEQFDRAIQLAQGLVKDELSPAHLALAVEIYQRCDRPDEAVRLGESHAKRHAGQLGANLLYAAALSHAGNLLLALEVLEKLVTQHPHNFRLARRLCRLHVRLNQMDKAEAVLHQLLAGPGAGQPTLVASVVELRLEQGILGAAEDELHQALARFPQNLELWLKQARLEKKLGHAEGEARVWRTILQTFHPRQWPREAVKDLVRLNLLGPVQEALNAWRQEEPGCPAPWWLAFHISQETKNTSQSLQLLDRIEERHGISAEIYQQRHDIHQEAWRVGSALTAIRSAIALRPNSIAYKKSLFALMIKSGDFSGVDELLKELKRDLGDRRYASYSSLFFNLNCHPDWTEADIWSYYRDWYTRSVKQQIIKPQPHPNSREPARKLRVGYISPDFRQHAVAYFSEALLMHHDRDDMETFAYAHLEPGQADGYTDRFRSYFDHWHEIREMGDDELERLIRHHGIDILVDLAGHTANGRLSVLMRKPAPLQISYLFGAGQTTGLPQIDYLVADQWALPERFSPFCSETICRYSFIGFPYRPPGGVPPVEPLPCLTQGYITFGVLARPLRTNDRTIKAWADILQRVPGSRLCFDHAPYAEAEVTRRLVGVFERYNIPADRLIFRNTRPHWNAYSQVDLLLDTFPAGSGTVSTEALYMGRPVITLNSRPPMGRIPASQLMALDLQDDCVADDVTGYVEKAVILASHLDRLMTLSSDLRSRMESSRLMDYQAFSRDIAHLYRQLWQSYCQQGQVP